MAYLGLKHWGVHIHGLDMRAQNESYQMTYAIKTVENLLTCYEHEIYPMMMEINQS